MMGGASRLVNSRMGAPALTSRWLSSPTDAMSPNLTALDRFVPQPPTKLTEEMAESITDMTQMYIRYGAANQRLKILAKEKDIPIVFKWQKMMEIFFHAQLHIVNGFGYPGDENGLMQYSQDLANFHENNKAEDFLLLLKNSRRDTWRALVSTTFELDAEEIPNFSIVDARNLMHKVSSRMQAPDVLYQLQQNVSTIQNDDKDMELAMKHSALQQVIVNHVYLGHEEGQKSVVEEAECGTGPEAYAKFQCALSDFEGDPLIMEYTQSAMGKMFEAAGLNPGPQGPKPSLMP